MEEEFGDVWTILYASNIRRLCIVIIFFLQAGAQVEVLADEHKSLIWYLVKQVRPGMDLSKVVLPTFILEPRSFLDKLTDSYYHVDILSR